MNDVTSLQLIIGREDENEYIKIDLNEYNEKYKRLQQRIDKAIEYIDSLWLDDSGKILEIKERLHFILKGNDIDESK